MPGVFQGPVHGRRAGSQELVARPCSQMRCEKPLVVSLPLVVRSGAPGSIHARGGQVGRWSMWLECGSNLRGLLAELCPNLSLLMPN